MSAVVVGEATLPADLEHLTSGAAVVVVDDPLAFPFESLPSPRPFALALTFDDRETADDLWAQFGEVLFSRLVSHDIVAGPAALIELLEARTVLEREAMLDVADPQLAGRFDERIASVDAAAVAHEVDVRRAVGAMAGQAIDEVPAQMTPVLGWANPASARLAGDVSLACELLNVADGGRCHLAVAQLEGGSAAEVEALWRPLYPGGSLVVVAPLDSPGSYDHLLDMVATVSGGHAVLADVATTKVAPMVVVRVHKLGRDAPQ